MDVITTEQVEQLDGNKRYQFSGTYAGVYLPVSSPKDSNEHYINTRILLKDLNITVNNQVFLFNQIGCVPYSSSIQELGNLNEGDAISFQAKVAPMNYSSLQSYKINDRSDYHVAAPYNATKNGKSGSRNNILMDEYFLPGYFLDSNYPLIVNMDELNQYPKAKRIKINMYKSDFFDVPLANRGKREIWETMKKFRDENPDLFFNANLITDEYGREYDFIKAKNILTSDEEIKLCSQLIDYLMDGDPIVRQFLSPKQTEAFEAGEFEYLIHSKESLINGVKRKQRKFRHSLAYYNNKVITNKDVCDILIQQQKTQNG